MMRNPFNQTYEMLVCLHFLLFPIQIKGKLSLSAKNFCAGLKYFQFLIPGKEYMI